MTSPGPSAGRAGPARSPPASPAARTSAATDLRISISVLPLLVHGAGVESLRDKGVGPYAVGLRRRCAEGLNHQERRLHKLSVFPRPAREPGPGVVILNGVKDLCRPVTRDPSL